MTDEYMTARIADMQADWERRYDLAAIPKRLRGTSLVKVSDQFEYKQKIINFSNLLTSDEGTKYGIFMHGPYRSGKTSLAAGLAMHAIRHGIHVYFARFNNLFELYKENPQWHPDSEAGVWDWMKKVKLLVVDDLYRNANEKYGKLNAQVFEQLLEHRLDNGLLHIFTSNVSIEELEDTYAVRTASLIEQCCYIQEIAGMDYSEFIAQRRQAL